MATNRGSKGSLTAVAQQLIVGTNKHLGSLTSAIVQGSSLTPAQIVQRLQTIVQLRSDAEAAKAAGKAKLAQEKTALPALRAFVTAYVNFLRGAFDGTPDALADFGVTPKAPARMTAEAKTAAAVKRKATRAARHVMGSKQKKSVKGNVGGILVTPLPEPQTTATTPATPMTSATLATPGPTNSPTNSPTPGPANSPTNSPAAQPSGVAPPAAGSSRPG